MTVSDIPRTTRVVTLASRPSGLPVPDNFRLEEHPIPELASGQVLLRNLFMSVDPSMRGRMDQTEKHYTTNFPIGGALDGSALGRVVDSRSADLSVGDVVRHRLGWRDFAVVDAAAATRIDDGRAPLAAWLGILGQPGFTAYAGLVRAGELRTGDTVFVSAAAGAVGGAAGQFARLLGAEKVIGSAGGASKARLLVDEFGYDVGLDYRSDLRSGLADAAPEGIDLYFDNVGGDQLITALYSLRLNGRVALCGAISTMDDPADSPGIGHLIQAVLKRLTLRGFIVRDHEDLRTEFEDRVIGWLRTGEVVSKDTVVDGIDHAVDALVGLLTGANVGKMLVRLGDEQ